MERWMLEGGGWFGLLGGRGCTRGLVPTLLGFSIVLFDFAGQGEGEWLVLKNFTISAADGFGRHLSE